MSSIEKQHCAATYSGRPLVWESEDSGQPLYDKQTIGDAVEKLLKNPSVGAALPRIPGKSDEDIPYSDDISTIGAQYGLLMTERIRITNGATESLLLIREKLLLLEKVNRRRPGLYTQVLGIHEKSKFDSFAARMRLLRNEIAHPHPGDALGKDLDPVPILETDKEYARRLADWDVRPFSRR
jgi:hypothetical protein